MQVFSKEQIKAVVSLDHAALQVIEEAFAALGRDAVCMPPIMSMNILESNGEVDVKTAHIRGYERFAIKISSGFFDNVQLGLPSLSGLMIVFSAKTGEVEAVLFDEGYLTDVRTALAGALAAKYLSRETAKRVTVIGSGLQAELQVAALQLVRPIEQVDVFARNYQHMQAYQQRMHTQYGLPVTLHEDVVTACAQADIIVTTTPSSTPVLPLNALQPGVHVTAMGSDNSHKQELESAILEQADFMVVDRRSQSETLGELHHVSGTFGKSVYELGQLIAQKTYLRTAAEQITICDLTGTGVQDTAIANFTLNQLMG